MNEREQFRQWGINFMSDYDSSPTLFDAYQAGAESKQSELNKANARIAQLEEVLEESGTALYYGMANINNHGPKEGSKLDETAKHMDRVYDLVEGALNGLSDTWLSQHDKAIEVRTLLEAADEVDRPLWTSGDAISKGIMANYLRGMAKTRK